MSEQIIYIDKEKKEIIHNKTGYRCIYCGRDAYGRCSVEHIIPQSIYKWVGAYLTAEDKHELFNIITDRNNTWCACMSCNESKNEHIINRHDINNLHIDNTSKGEIKSLLDRADTYIKDYKGIKSRILKKQKFKCYTCSFMSHNIDNFILRRDDHTKARSLENGVLLCERCNQIKSFEKY